MVRKNHSVGSRHLSAWQLASIRTVKQHYRKLFGYARKADFKLQAPLGTAAATIPLANTVPTIQKVYGRMADDPDGI
jgi:hypothetical protein